MGLSDAARLEVLELIRRELERALPLRNLATKEDIKLLVETMSKRFEAVDKRFEDVNKRFEAMDRRFEELVSYMDKRFE
ncbi:MAG: hypothetical protein ACTSWP_05590, partial [Candidatus Freyarchaeota archaeon]